MSETSTDLTGTEKQSKKKSLPRYRGHSRLAKSGPSGSLSVPAEMMSVLNAAGSAEGLLFKPELTKDGILFRIVDEDKIAADEKAVPAWVKKTSSASTVQVGNTTNDGTDDDSVPPDSDGDDAIVDDAADGDEEPPVTDEEPF